MGKKAAAPATPSPSPHGPQSPASTEKVALKVKADPEETKKAVEEPWAHT